MEEKHLQNTMGPSNTEHYKYKNDIHIIKARKQWQYRTSKSGQKLSGNHSQSCQNEGTCQVSAYHGSELAYHVLFGEAHFKIHISDPK